MTSYRITEVSQTTGLSTRALRHYETLSLIESRRAANGYREYDDAALLRIQRILVLRNLGVGLAQIAQMLSKPTQAEEALMAHARQLEAERDRINRQLAALQRSIRAIQNGEPLMTADPFDGFDHTAYEQEVTERWGAESYRSGDDWWRSMSADERSAWKANLAQLQVDWVSAATSGENPTGAHAQALSARQAEWLRGIPGTPNGPDELPGYLRGLGDMYVADARFTAQYGGPSGAAFVRDALHAYADSIS